MDYGAVESQPPPRPAGPQRAPSSRARAGALVFAATVFVAALAFSSSSSPFGNIGPTARSFSTTVSKLLATDDDASPMPSEEESSPTPSPYVTDTNPPTMHSHEGNDAPPPPTAMPTLPPPPSPSPTAKATPHPTAKATIKNIYPAPTASMLYTSHGHTPKPTTPVGSAQAPAPTALPPGATPKPTVPNALTDTMPPTQHSHEGDKAPPPPTAQPTQSMAGAPPGATPKPTVPAGDGSAQAPAPTPLPPATPKPTVPTDLMDTNPPTQHSHEGNHAPPPPTAQPTAAMATAAANSAASGPR